MKKKGLIIATIVMVLVLAVSLTTATYAWFSSTGAVTVENLSVSATALEGLEIAIKTNTNASPYTTGYTYGTVNYNASNSTWSSTETVDGFGSYLDFDAVEVGNISNAVTNTAASAPTSSIPATSKFVYTEVELSGEGAVTASHYTLDTNGKPTVCEAGNPVVGTKYYTRAAVEDGVYYIPTGYNENTQPYGFFAVNPNAAGTYYDLPIRVKSTMNVQAIVCALTINSTATGAFAPGMAAATRVKIGFGKNNGAESTYTGFEPYESATSTVSGMTNNDVAGENELDFVVAYASASTANVVSTDVYTVHVILWVEGTDPECNNYTTSATNFTVDFSFKYTKSAGDVDTDNGKVTIESKEYTILSGYSQVVNPSNP